jgi:hypothetical protein
MNLLQIVSEVRIRLGMPEVTTVFGNADRTSRQMVALLQKAVDLKLQDYQDTRFKVHYSKTTLGAELQGTIASLFGAGSVLSPGTMYLTASQQLVPEVLNDQQAAWIRQSIPSGTANPVYEIKAGSLYFLPAPVAGLNYTVTALTRNWLTSGVSVITADTDTFLLPDSLLVQGLEATWKQSKGLPYIDDMMSFNRLFAQVVADAQTPTQLTIGEGPKQVYGVGVPERSWNL